MAIPPQTKQLNTMLSKNYPVSQLESSLTEGLKKYGLKESVIKRHSQGLSVLLNFMKEKEIRFFNDDVFDAYRQALLSDSIHSPNYRKEKYCTLCTLSDILEGRPHSRHDIRTPQTEAGYHDEMGNQITSFLAAILAGRVNKRTMQMYEKTLKCFRTFICMHSGSFRNLTRADITEYVSSLQNSRPNKLLHLRKFLSYLHSERITNEDFSKMFSHVRAIRREKIPSYYSKEEILRLEHSIDRSGSLGKRDYAMVLLATRLGLRSSDIRTLKFSNIDWDRNEITLIQYKTGRRISLPLLEDVGCAIIDYVRNARPSVPFKEIFVTCGRPYRVMSASGCSSIVQRCLYNAGIDTKGRHSGMHCLRHSLATQMMNNGIAMPVISEALGHKSTESTMYYLGVNINNLLECSLDVPLISQDFYEQKGGVLYE